MSEDERTSRLAALRRVRAVAAHYFTDSPLELLTSDLDELDQLIKVEEHRAHQRVALDRQAMVGKFYYFGCLGNTGHYLHDVYLCKAWNHEQRLPWDQLDGPLCPDDPTQTQGVAKLTQKDGWTALGFWDRSVDHRGNSNSVFIVAQETTFKHIIELAHVYFEPVMKRLPFDVVPA